MGRGKLPLRLIPKERARRITFAKRKKGLLKKAYELSTLCDVKVCVLIDDSRNQLSDHHDHRHNHDHHDHKYQHQPGQIQTWPEQPHEVESIIAMYLAYKAKNPVSKKDLDLTDFFKDKIKRLQHETKKLAEENNKIMMLKSHPDHHHDHLDQHHDHQFELWDNRIDGFSLAQIEDLKIHLDQIISHANKHWSDRCNSMMIMRVTPHNSNCYHDHDHHQFGISTSHLSPMRIMMDHGGNSYQTSDCQYDNFNYHNINNQFVIPQYDPHTYHDPAQYSWRHDQPSSSKTVPFDNHMVSSFMNNVPRSGSFTSMMLNNHETDYNHEDEGQYYSRLMNIGSSIFDDNNNIISGNDAVTSAMNDHDHHVLHHHQHGVFLNHADMALQPYMRPFADGLRYSPSMGPVYEQYSPANQFRASSSQKDVKFHDNHGVGKAPAARCSLNMD